MLRTPVDQWVSEKIGVAIPELSQEKLESYQLEKARELIAYAKQRGAFYKEAYKDIDPTGIRNMEDFSRLPTICEADLAGNEYRFQCVSPSDVVRMVTVPTTGTSGNQKRLAFTLHDLSSALEFIHVGFLTMCQRGDRMLVMMSGGTEGSIGDSVEKALRSLDIETRVYGAITDISQAYQYVREFCPDIIVGIPVQAAALARYSEIHGGLTSVRSVLLSADDVPQSICDRLAKLWDCNVFRHYGMTEMCIAGGVECHAHTGYHMRSCDILLEILEPDAEGYGEIAITTLGREGMPLIRYRSGDIGKMAFDPCGCGSVLPRLLHIKGRRRNSYTTGSGTVFLSEIAEVAYSDPSVLDFECCIHSDDVTLTVKTLPGDMPDLERIDRALRRCAALASTDISVQSEHVVSFSNEYNAKKRLVII